MDGDAEQDVTAALAPVATESGRNVLALAEASPVLLVFLRHFGCPFCRRTIGDVAELRTELAKRGVRPVFVHMGTPEVAKATFDYYGMSDVERVNDPGAVLYKHPAFALAQTGMISQVLKWPVVMAAARTLLKHGIGKIEGDGQQMPGIFFLKERKIVRRFVPRTIADQADYLGLVA